ncbi:TPA: IS1 family transposase, partial [Escherichia coli]|nr:IS1 family transposase [Escherichia coli]
MTGKIFTQGIKRNLKNRIKHLARRASGFSHSVELHETV